MTLHVCRCSRHTDVLCLVLSDILCLYCQTYYAWFCQTYFGTVRRSMLGTVRRTMLVLSDVLCLVLSDVLYLVLSAVLCLVQSDATMPSIVRRIMLALSDVLCLVLLDILCLYIKLRNRVFLHPTYKDTAGMRQTSCDVLWCDVRQPSCDRPNKVILHRPSLHILNKQAFSIKIPRLKFRLASCPRVTTLSFFKAVSPVKN